MSTRPESALLESSARQKIRLCDYPQIPADTDKSRADKLTVTSCGLKSLSINPGICNNVAAVLVVKRLGDKYTLTDPYDTWEDA